MKEMYRQEQYKLTLLKTAEHLKNVEKACKIFNVSRQYYYNVKKLYEQYGISGLREKERKDPEMPNKTPSEKEREILAYSIKNPTYGKERVSGQLSLKGVFITASGVASIWRRNKMSKRRERLQRFEETHLGEWGSMTKEQMDMLLSHSQELKEQHVISDYPGNLLCQDTLELGRLKGIGRMFVQVVIDTHGSYGFAKIFTSKTQVETADVLIDKVLPMYSSLGIPVNSILTDNGKEYCGVEGHFYEDLLASLNIEHRRTKVRSPKTNGFVERFNRTLLEEFFVIRMREKWFTSIEELQADLDAWLWYYNFERSHQGYRVRGRTPFQVLTDFSVRPKLLLG